MTRQTLHGFLSTYINFKVFTMSQVSAHSGFVGQSGVQAHSAGADFPVVVAIVGDYPRPHNRGFYRVSNQGVSRDVSDCAGRDRYVALHKNAERIADAIWSAFRNRSGCTVCIDGSDCPDRGYVSGVYGYETIFECADLTYREVYTDVFGKLEKSDLVRYEGNPACIGSWVSSGRLYLDISVIFADRSDCEGFARYNSQLAYFDIAEGVEYAV